MGSRPSSKRKSRGDKISSKKKSRRKESKKRRRSYDSVSSSSDDDSLYLEHKSSTSKSDHRRRITKTNKRRHDSRLSDYQSDSDSSSTDDNDYKMRKARRSRVGLRDVKRKRRKRSISSIADVDATGGRKRKRSGKDHVIKPIKKSSKKKSRNVVYSSSGSDSKSRSSSQSRSRSRSSSGDDKRQKNKVVPDKEKERLRRRQSHMDKQKHEDRSPSCTSIGRGGDPSFSVSSSDREPFPVDNSRRLRSVIAVADQPRGKDENRWEMDPHKEEIVYDQNDYPSPKSFDSNEGGSKMESGNRSSLAFSDRICLENIAGDEVCKLGKSRIDEGNHHQSEGHINKSKEKEIETSVPVAAPGGDALESILRQKALENLRKFREMPQTRPRSNMVERFNETNVATFSDRTVDIVENFSIEHGVSDAQEMNNQRNGLPDSAHIEERPRMLPDSEHVEERPGMLPDSEHVEERPQMPSPSITPSRNGSALLECSQEDKRSHSPAVEVKAVSGNDTSTGAGVTQAFSSSNVELTSGEHSSGQTKDSSQFEKKTMTVMRGGELVQVSYKVYIPKKAPALVRRQLKR
ncbi:uncharacterized protein LOC130987015 isoform X2 [Salvia miltiorrhiza]|uniref:uncharacterized protein LOC130987015 isoform X2 n=1 Tax=Salvia miltiorrhiza TaxID=226208 RepID=UPI0025AD41BE|nr:uncharacterized protein LOC130987015 isoform X2 [Salvia miltiorrhiza]